MIEMPVRVNNEINILGTAAQRLNIPENYISARFDARVHKSEAFRINNVGGNKTRYPRSARHFDLKVKQEGVNMLGYPHGERLRGRRDESKNRGG